MLSVLNLNLCYSVLYNKIFETQTNCVDKAFHFEGPLKEITMYYLRIEMAQILTNFR